MSSIGTSMATVSSLPHFDGDGYSYGGGTILTISDISLQFGCGRCHERLARELASRWNMHPELLTALKGVVHLHAERSAENNEPLSPEFQDSEIAEAMRVIARAEGRQP